MKLSYVGFYLAVVLLSFSALASEPARPSAALAIPGCAELNRLWKTRYYWALKFLHLRRGIACEGDVAPAVSPERAFAEAAYILENTRFQTEGASAEYVAPPVDMLAFLTSKYLALRIDQKTTVPYTNLKTRMIYFYPNVAQESGWQVIGNLIHESRHADTGLNHVLCDDGPNQGKQMCDDGLGDQMVGASSHRAAALYFAWGANARSNWPKAKRDAFRNLAEWIVRTRINATESQRSAWIAKYLHDW